MNNSDQPQSNVTWSELGQPISNHYGDMYFSIADGLAESRYVFLEQNQLPQRFAQLSDNEHFIIGETGFGTGLNFLTTWECWLKHAPINTHLHFISTEKYPLSYKELQQSLNLWPSLNTLIGPLLDAYKKQFLGTNEPHYYCFEFNRVTLTLIVNDVCEGLRQLLPQQHQNFNKPQWQCIDAWFLDGFSPTKNPDMWSDELIQLIHILSKDSVSLSTYTAATSVKKVLESNGFKVTKKSGFGKKRELITAKISHKNNSNKLHLTHKNQTPWAYNHKLTHTHEQNTLNATIAIIGGGLAGCHTAYALAKKGFKVEIFETLEDIANEASGNPQAMLYTKLSANKEPLAEFNLACLLKAQNFYTQFWAQCDKKIDGQQCGLLQLAQSESTQKKQTLLWDRLQHANFLQKTTSKTGSILADINIHDEGLWLPYSGWLNPQALCRWLIDDKNILLHTKTHIKRIEATAQQQWQLDIEHCNNTRSTRTFSNVVICNAYSATQFDQTSWLPTKALRGQVSYITSQGAINTLKTVITGENYIAPELKSGNKENFHTIGASYDLKNTHKQLTDIEHQQNIDQLNNLLPSIKKNKLHIIGGRANLRCTSPDYLPLVGNIPNREQFLSDFQALSYNAKQAINKTGEYLSGIYLNTGHGSRGLAYTPMAAEVIACHLAHTPPPLPQDLLNSLNPARFIIRSIKNKSRIQT